MPDRPPFRTRLTRRLGGGLALALATIGVAVWFSAALLLRHQAREVLQTEIATVQSEILADDGRLHPERYSWSEPHHRFDSEHIDPYFLQVFDASGTLLRASDNVALFSPGAFPTERLYVNTPPALFSRLTTFNAGGHHLYRITEEVNTASGATAGYIQLSRYAPMLRRPLRRLAISLFLGLSIVLAGLLALVWTVGGRVVRPLERITSSADGLSAQTLSERVPVPDDADREAAALARTLNEALERLDRSFDEMRRFTSNAAHELQTPLTVLTGHIDVALRRERDPEAYRETLRVLRREVNGLVGTVRGLLALARLDGGGAGLPTETLDIAAIVRIEVEAARAAAVAKGISLEVGAAGPAMARGNETLVREVARNLIDNAIKYTSAGGVEVSVSSTDTEASLVVADTGIGIDFPEQATARFWRSDAVQHLPGSGLGLALVERTVSAHGGRLTFERRPQGGTRVEAVFPA